VLILSAVAYGSVDVQQAFADFMRSYSKEYLSTEIYSRFSIFKSNLALIEEHNKQNSGWTMGVNQFADLTSEEFEKIYLGYKPSTRTRNEVSLFGTPATEVDWTAKEGIVTPVKDQGQCGSCWAFSTTGSVESANALKNGKLVSVSEQQLVDCSSSTGNQGCNGGLMDDAFKWIIQNKGIAAESDYPYKAKDQTCTKGLAAALTISSYTDVKAKNEDELKVAVTSQPVSVAVDARKWQLYQSGVFNNCGLLIQLDHGVLAVGYSDAGGYWKIKNSWGTSWGEKGFIRLKSTVNECGLANEPSYPVA
jgi:C1A family cysteine protease